MKKHLFALLLVILLAYMSATIAVAGTLTIGSMSPLSGPYRADGNDIVNGVRTAIALMEENGGIPGYDRIELRAEDTACNPAQAVVAANKLINLEVAGVIGAYCSSATLPASETLAEEDFIMITPASTNEMVTDRGLPYMFRACGRDDDQSKVTARFLKEQLQAKTIFIVDDQTTYSRGLADSLRRECERSGLAVLGHGHVNQGDQGFSEILKLIKNKNPDAFYMCLQNHSSGSVMAVQARKLGLKTRIVSQDAMFHPNFIKVAGQAAEGIFVSFGYTDNATASYKHFAEYYQTHFGEIGAYATYAFDAATILLTAIKQAGSTQASRVKNEIMKMDFQGASKTIRFQPNGDSGSNYILFKIENGGYVRYWSPESGLF